MAEIELEEIELEGVMETPQVLPATVSTEQWKLARLTAYGYFSLLVVPLLFLLIGILNVNETIDLIKTLAAILSGIVGMVWGFYFYNG